MSTDWHRELYGLWEPGRTVETLDWWCQSHRLPVRGLISHHTPVWSFPHQCDDGHCIHYGDDTEKPREFTLVWAWSDGWPGQDARAMKYTCSPIPSMVCLYDPACSSKLRFEGAITDCHQTYTLGKCHCDHHAIIKSAIAHLASGWIHVAMNSASDVGSVATLYPSIGVYPVSWTCCPTQYTSRGFLSHCQNHIAGHLRKGQEHRVCGSGGSLHLAAMAGSRVCHWWYSWSLVGS